MFCKTLLFPNELQKRKMGTSPYFDRMMFWESSATDRIFEERSGGIFQTSVQDSFVDVHVQTRCPDDGIVRATVGSSHDRQLKTSVQFESSPATANIFKDLTAPDKPVDKCEYICQPPNYVPERGLSPMRIRDPVKLEDTLKKVGKLWRHVFWLLSVD